MEDGRMIRGGRTFVAVKNVNFKVKRGEIFGLLGPNGAGKTTTIKMISTLLEPTRGKVLVNGYDVVKDARKVRQSLGTVLSGERSIYWKLTGRENLEYFGALYGMKRKEAKARAQELLERLDLSKRGDELVENYSSGMKQRIALGKALMADPPILLLDEPTVGLDPQAALRLREIIMELKEEGKTILLTTHYMEEADILCDRIAIIDQGEIIALAPPSQLKAQLSEKRMIQLTVRGLSDEVQNKLNKVSHVERVLAHYDDEKENWQITIHSSNGEETITDIIQTLTKEQVQIQNVNVKEPTLEDVFIHLTGKSLRE
ncbi:ABC transporter ATP-binding protein [Anoxybacter fermentans]|uniref:ABC transporter ATP-binding protein n=2 Tax=Anoxybacter fermentans TaxID=1323375 RepID=A0A3Q9HTL2_9FIRM|nr:ABC transporter ATP-binding protein [Anoxybacter fermentans]